MRSGRIRRWEISLLERSQRRVHPPTARQRFQADLDRFLGAAQPVRDSKLDLDRFSGAAQADLDRFSGAAQCCDFIATGLDRPRGEPHLAIHLTGGERSEMTGFLPLLNAGRVKRLGPGRPKQRPMQLIADRGYSSYKVRKELQRRGIRPVLPPKRSLQRPWFYDSEQYRKRNQVERAVNRLKRYRRIATRYDKCAKHFQAWTLFACVLEWLVP